MKKIPKCKKTPCVLYQDDISGDERFHFKFRRLVDTGKLLEIQFSSDGKSWVQGSSAYMSEGVIWASFITEMT